ncbi:MULTISPECIES: glycosyltransferase family 4 protein [unclassified Caballeronia]|jgi:glycosyltransferase involved in cell wall biosynthesis|uniref:glycosyltransferase family 4 protein n=1 Tax=unclassified Caballeronia TaxID=2646786 RepID=UPI002029876B|nr:MULTISPECIES: glycosyltransferase family 4 protein [unclassified Caballeronia]MDR5794999.1 glycosyltransferase family 4 protein [Caballeronia sp. LZ008]
MRIAQVSTLYESVPPRRYGGIERVVSWLTEELVKMGHDVTLFASADSRTRAKLVASSDCAVRLLEDTADPQAFHFAMLEDVVRASGDFDIVHFHTDYMSFPYARRLDAAHVTTLHWRLDVPGLDALYRRFADVPLVSISDAQREPMPWAGWTATVHHGMPAALLPFQARAEQHLAFVGRIAPSKGPDAAIRIARRANVPLRIAAKIDEADRPYFIRDVEPLIEAPHVEFVGELDDHGKRGLLGHARAMLFPIAWPEPFGIAMIEALACGTPVIAFGRGSVPEIIEHGVSGFIVRDEDEAVEAVARLPEIDRRACRARFEQFFTAERMARAYVEVYERLVRERTARLTLTEV